MKKETLKKGAEKLNMLDLIETIINKLVQDDSKVAILTNGFINKIIETTSENAAINSRIKRVLLAELQSIRTDIEQDIENL